MGLIGHIVERTIEKNAENILAVGALIGASAIYEITEKSLKKRKNLVKCTCQPDSNPENKKVSIHFNSETFIGQDIEIVKEQILSYGFNNVFTCDLVNLEKRNCQLDETVYKISIGNKFDFSDEKPLKKDIRIVIYYNGIKREFIPRMISGTAHHHKTLTYEEFVKSLEFYGFYKIETVPRYDLKRIQFLRKHQLAYITVNGTKRYGSKPHKINEPIVVYYHEFADNKPIEKDKNEKNENANNAKDECKKDNKIVNEENNNINNEEKIINGEPKTIVKLKDDITFETKSAIKKINYCSNCGHPISSANSNFCGNCGKKINR